VLGDVQRGPNGIEVVGDGGRAVELDARTETGAARCHEAGQIKAERILGGEPGTAERTRPARAARVDQQDVAAAAQRSQQLTPVGRLLGVR